jgi:DNA-binding beta-propeller fold protein YncE
VGRKVRWKMKITPKKEIRSSLKILLAIVVMACFWGQPSQADIGTPITIGLGGSPGNIVYDSFRNKLYDSNNSLNQLDVINLSSRSVESPIFVGSQPRGLDIDGTGQYLYVCNYGAMNISKVDLNNRVEVSRPSVPDFPTNIAIAKDGTGQIRTNDYYDDAYGGYNFNAQTGTVGNQIENYWYDAVSPNKQFRRVGELAAAGATGNAKQPCCFGDE